MSDEELAELAHRLWSHWSMHIAEEEDISQERVERWRDLWVPYGELPEGAKDTDRRLVDRFLEEQPEYDSE